MIVKNFKHFYLIEKILLPLHRQNIKGVSSRTEIIPSKPDAGNAAVGIESQSFLKFSKPDASLNKSIDLQYDKQRTSC